MIDVEPLIAASFDRMLPEPVVAGDWADVLERAGVRATRSRSLPVFGMPRRRFVVVALALVALVVVVGAAAYALGHPIVRFGAAPRVTSRTVVNYFGQMTVDAIPTPVRPHQARLITTVSVNGRDYRLIVAPVRGGGFCFLWQNFFLGSCGRPRTFLGSVQGTSTAYKGREYYKIIGGTFPQAHAAHVVLRYADGESAEIPFVWVTAPIRSGFFLYGIPEAHQRPGHQPVRISLTNPSGAVIASQRMFGSTPIPHFTRRHQGYPLVPHRLAGYPRLMVPAPAEWAKRKQLFSTRADDGTRVGLWIAPSRAGGTCYWSNVHAGCGHLRPDTGGSKLKWDPKLGVYDVHNSPGGPSPHYLFKTLRRPGLVAVCCTLDPRVRRVELTFQDGDQVTVTAKHGYLIWPIPRRRYLPGHRLDNSVFLGSKGQILGGVPFDPKVRAFYPCVKPKNYGYGLRMCP